MREARGQCVMAVVGVLLLAGCAAGNGTPGGSRDGGRGMDAAVTRPDASSPAEGVGNTRV